MFKVPATTREAQHDRRRSRGLSGPAGLGHKLLHDRGHQVVARGDGDSFIALLRSQVVDAALLDWEVPGASGLSVLSWARSI